MTEQDALKNWKKSAADAMDTAEKLFIEREIKEISSFNVSARYDDYKFSFYKKATRNYASSI